MKKGFAACLFLFFGVMVVNADVALPMPPPPPGDIIIWPGHSPVAAPALQETTAFKWGLFDPMPMASKVYLTYTIQIEGVRHLKSLQLVSGSGGVLYDSKKLAEAVQITVEWDPPETANPGVEEFALRVVDRNRVNDSFGFGVSLKATDSSGNELMVLGTPIQSGKIGIVKKHRASEEPISILFPWMVVSFP